MRINNIDHIVFTVNNIDAACRFYSRVLGMRIIEFGEGRKALSFGETKINLHEKGKELEPKALNPVPGSIDICFITDIPMKDMLAHIDSCGIKVIEGPVKRSGSLGPIESIYLRDPDGNLIEVSNRL
ncbi:MAG: VOC family protein [Deltaproteobacteria bacterium]|nr:VOC family protein [Deltaproteobacteria bacterium]MCL5892687.1 VOC family protein [Deltaproteobacteria bacterium]